MNRFYRFAYTILAPILRGMFRMEIIGKENLPAGGALICPNHSSNWDPLLMLAALPIDYHLRCMAKDSLFRIPVLSKIILHCGGFPVARGQSDIQAVKTALKVIKDGENLLIFPEGTRVAYEGEVRAKGGVSMIAVRSGAVIIPAFITREKKLFKKVRIIFGEEYHPVFAGRKPTPEENQQIADEILERAYALGRESA